MHFFDLPGELLVQPFYPSAHELGHALLKHKLYRFEEFGTERDAEEERQANIFAEELLIPFPFLKSDGHDQVSTPAHVYFPRLQGGARNRAQASPHALSDTPADKRPPNTYFLC
ncbi:ImmA/IrrE family metallo-endopeptidase [Neomoorella thermoacetica]|uniref:ImmA/IrrE family metallo-endopeptidase n=1 Tax=Neomoorella thermoacetica TaxID=1525 RepID=UPI0009BD2713